MEMDSKDRLGNNGIATTSEQHNHSSCRAQLSATCYFTVAFTKTCTGTKIVSLIYRHSLRSDWWWPIDERVNASPDLFRNGNGGSAGCVPTRHTS
jgi:hypothetical protein